jgi:hypothetical protein
VYRPSKNNKKEQTMVEVCEKRYRKEWIGSKRGESYSNGNVSGV